MEQGPTFRISMPKYPTKDLLPGQRHEITSFDALMAGNLLLGLDRR
jgi:hypothetical protein